jgi:hypothetical protein
MVAMAQLLLRNLLKYFHLETEEDKKHVGQHSGTTMKRQTVRM